MLEHWPSCETVRGPLVLDPGTAAALEAAAAAETDEEPPTRVDDEPEPAKLAGGMVDDEDSERTDFATLAEAGAARPPIPFTSAQTPVNDPESSETVYWAVTSGPGLGNWTSFPSTVVQPFPRFATNRLGRLANGVDSALDGPEAPVIVTEAQDM